MNKTIELNFIKKLDENLKLATGVLQVILGPRQVGKTTTILKYFQEKYEGKYFYTNADNVLNANHDWIITQWEYAKRDRKILIIDEIQKCFNWSETIKKLWDESKREKNMVPCILLGSSSLDIQRGLTESLTGRFQLIRAYHWNAAESKKGYGISFDAFMKVGGYPGSYLYKDSKDWRQYLTSSIVSTVVEKDILQFNTVKNPALFKQAFEMIMAYPAMEISYTKLLGQLQSKGNVDLVKYYLELYQGAFLIKILEKYSGSRLRIKSSSPKILPLAPCFFYLTHLDEYSSEEKGRVFEAMVGAQLVRTEEDLFYWREGAEEVDFVLKRGKKIWAIEVKSGRLRKPNGLMAFMKKYPEAKPVIIRMEDYEVFEKDPMAFLGGV